MKTIKKKFALTFIFFVLAYFLIGSIYTVFYIDKINAREDYIVATANSIIKNEEVIKLRESIMKKKFKRSFIIYIQSDSSWDEIINKYKPKLSDYGYNVENNKQSLIGKKNEIIITIEKNNKGYYILAEFDDVFNKLNL